MEPQIELSTSTNQVVLRDCDTYSTSTASNSDIDIEIAETPPNTQISEASRAQNDAITMPPSNISTNINSLALQSTSGVHFGNRVIYNGPVNIDGKKDEARASESFGFGYILRHKATLIPTACSFVLFALLVLVLAIKYDNSVNESTVSYPYQLKIIKRQEWGAKEPSAVPELLSTPVDVILVDCTGKTDCFSEKTCSETMRLIQESHMSDKGYPDIGYNFVIGNNGLVYEGTGWDVRGHYPFEVDYYLNQSSFKPNSKDVISFAINGKDCISRQTFDQRFAGNFLSLEGRRLLKFTNQTVVMDLPAQRDRLLKELTNSDEDWT